MASYAFVTSQNGQDLWFITCRAGVLEFSQPFLKGKRQCSGRMEGIWMVIAGAVYLWVTQPTGIWEWSIWSCRMPPHEPGYVPSTAPTFSARVRSSTGSWRGILIGSTSSGLRAECHQRPRILIFRYKSFEFPKTQKSWKIAIKRPKTDSFFMCYWLEGASPTDSIVTSPCSGYGSNTAKEMPHPSI